MGRWPVPQCPCSWPLLMSAALLPGRLRAERLFWKLLPHCREPGAILSSLQTWDEAKKKAYDQWHAGRGTAEQVGFCLFG